MITDFVKRAKRNTKDSKDQHPICFENNARKSFVGFDHKEKMRNIHNLFEYYVSK